MVGGIDYMVKVILFDFWGTLVENGVWSPIKQVRRILELRMSFPEYVVRMERAMMTTKVDSLRDAFIKVCEEFEIEPTDQKIEELVGMWNKNWMLAHPYPETVKVLERLQEKYILILISNTDPISVQNAIDKFGLQRFFKKMFFSCDVGLIKTDKEFLPNVISNIGISVNECVLVGDSVQSDIVAAQKAEVKSILVDRKGTRDYLPKIRSLEELEVFLNDN